MEKLTKAAKSTSIILHPSSKYHTQYPLTSNSSYILKSWHISIPSLITTIQQQTLTIPTFSSWASYRKGILLAHLCIGQMALTHSNLISHIPPPNYPFYESSSISIQHLLTQCPTILYILINLALSTALSKHFIDDSHHLPYPIPISPNPPFIYYIYNILRGWS